MSTSRFVHVVEDAVPDRRALIAQSPSMQQLLLRLHQDERIEQLIELFRRHPLRHVRAGRGS